MYSEVQRNKGMKSLGKEKGGKKTRKRTNVPYFHSKSCLFSKEQGEKKRR